MRVRALGVCKTQTEDSESKALQGPDVSHCEEPCNPEALSATRKTPKTLTLNHLTTKNTEPKIPEPQCECGVFWARGEQLPFVTLLACFRVSTTMVPGPQM